VVLDRWQTDLTTILNTKVPQICEKLWNKIKTIYFSQSKRETIVTKSPLKKLKLLKRSSKKLRRVCNGNKGSISFIKTILLLFVFSDLDSLLLSSFFIHSFPFLLSNEGRGKKLYSRPKNIKNLNGNQVKAKAVDTN